MKNLVRLYKKLTDTEITHGKNWYKSANEFCQFLANRYGLSHSQVCGIVSALSPACAWERNKLEAQWLIESNLEGYEMEPFNFTTYGSNVIKAQRIYEGENPEMLFNPKTGPKTYNFYKNLLNPENADFVTIDRHAIYAVKGSQDRVTPKQYNDIAELYKKAAQKLGIVPCEFQAMIWVGVKNNLI